MKFDHINIKAPLKLLEKEKDFLCDVFGFNVGPRPKLSPAGYWLYFNEQAIFHLNVSDEAVPISTTNVFDHIAFQSTDLFGFIEKLEKMQIPYRYKYVEELDLSQIFLNTLMNLKIEMNFLGEKI